MNEKIEIKSNQSVHIDYEGNKTELFTIFFTRNDATYNCCVDADKFEDGEIFLETLIPMFKELVNKLYPEIHDPLIKERKRLNLLKEQILISEERIAKLEEKTK